jgi:hypothetical protein
MADLFLEWNEDFIVDNTGDLLVVDGDVATRQRLERRLFTAVHDYIWHPEYGAGLPQKIGDPWTASEIEAIVTSQINLEASVAPSPPVQISVGEIVPGEVVIGVFYHDALTGLDVSFTISL